MRFRQALLDWSDLIAINKISDNYNNKKSKTTYKSNLKPRGGNFFSIFALVLSVLIFSLKSGSAHCCCSPEAHEE